MDDVTVGSGSTGWVALFAAALAHARRRYWDLKRHHFRRLGAEDRAKIARLRRMHAAYGRRRR